MSEERNWEEITNQEKWHSTVDDYPIKFLFKSGSFFNYNALESFQNLGVFFQLFMPETPSL
ncbi:MAG: hypothetical protein H6625_14100 [Bdellovibrionaceae bacterium]|nr:hypothetical protein [Pseudobdellovibrionaceae bacterium]